MKDSWMFTKIADCLTLENLHDYIYGADTRLMRMYIQDHLVYCKQCASIHSDMVSGELTFTNTPVEFSNKKVSLPKDLRITEIDRSLFFPEKTRPVEFAVGQIWRTDYTPDPDGIPFVQFLIVGTALGIGVDEVQVMPLSHETHFAGEGFKILKDNVTFSGETMVQSWLVRMVPTSVLTEYLGSISEDEVNEINMSFNKDREIFPDLDNLRGLARGRGLWKTHFMHRERLSLEYFREKTLENYDI